MKKFGVDSKVKKTLLRNCEQKIKSTDRKQAIHDVGCSSKLACGKTSRSSQKENELNQPTLCSSEALANYISDVKLSNHSPISAEDLNIYKSQMCSQMTKKLNYHFNDRIYKNLIELNANAEELKSKRNKRPTSSTSLKKDVEPNIEDFCEDEKEIDSPPIIPTLRPKFKLVKKVEDGQIHKLVAAFEDL